MNVEDINNRFVYHAPTDERRKTHENIRMECMALAHFLNESLPEGREKSLAITNLEEVMFWANAAVAREQE
jgi:hypothetical protein